MGDEDRVLVHKGSKDGLHSSRLKADKTTNYNDGHSPMEVDQEEGQSNINSVNKGLGCSVGNSPDRYGGKMYSETKLFQ